MKASAHIHVTLAVPIDDVWHDGTAIQEIRQQAKKSGLTKLFGALREPPGGIQIVGEPAVTIVLVEDV